ncbi:hypothetical protein E0W60_02490 [Cupriavidus oxalaticus]|uniref:Plasmid maintenance system killer n=1 Tax=Cupriavidus oxalaticus TaxID=96344 RepID=A0A4P7LCI6_9BURK|nr:type II toxin-antitoxin system RelE/ParE family toxin [Cupriavidus oxalaticus]QBY50107.1 hypothetical protein E0W60_02490 [Cupriavidus oxalaticus]
MVTSARCLCDKALLQPHHADRLRRQLGALDQAIRPEDLAGHWSVVVNGRWRLTFRFEGRDAIVVDYQDYH